MKTTLLLMACVLGFSSLSRAQTPTAILQNTLQTHLGGSVFPIDITLIGTIYDSGGKSQPMQIQVKGKDNLRFDLGPSDARRTTLFAAGSAWVQMGDQTTRLESHTAVRRPTIVPFLDLIVEFGNPALQWSYQGLQTLATGPAYHFIFRINDQTRAQQRPFGITLDEQADIYIDRSTLLIFRTERLRAAENDIGYRVPSILEFSDYRKVGPFALPFRIVNTIGTATTGFHQSTLVIQSATFNQGLSDSMFRPK